jgi:hypothetical protein
MLSKVEVLEAVKAAAQAPVGPAKPAGGCGRAYVCVSGERPIINAVSAACKKLGLLFLRKAYGAGSNAIYCGYDNCDGRALAKAEAVAAKLNEKGLRAYVDAVAD